MPFRCGISTSFMEVSRPHMKKSAVAIDIARMSVRLVTEPVLEVVERAERAMRSISFLGCPQRRGAGFLRRQPA